MPVHFRAPSATYNIKVAEKATLDCQVEGDQPITVHWSKGGARIHHNQHPGSQVSGYCPTISKKKRSTRYQLQLKSEPPASSALSQLTIHQVKMNDSGEYLCLAENTAGKANKTIRLAVQVISINDASSPLTSPPCPGCA